MLFLNVRFILDTLKEEYYKGTKFSAEYDHWRPQHKLCPFCILNFRSEEIKKFFIFIISWHLNILTFRIYSLLEENDEDALYFFTRAGRGSDFELRRENIQGEKGQPINEDVTQTHEGYNTGFLLSF